MSYLKTPAGQLLADGVSKRIDATYLLAPCDVDAQPGCCLVLRGPNGSGKSTLLRLLAGRLTPSSGTITLDGAPVDERQPAIRRAVASLIGQPAAYRELTVRDHLVLIDSTWAGDAPSAEERALAMLTTLQIDHLADRFPAELSSGQQQLFHLSLVLFRPGQVLLLDEPEQRLDTAKRELVAGLLTERVEAGATLVVACHDPAMTEQLADAVLDLDVVW